MIIDAHAHIFSHIAGQKGKEKTAPGKYGKVQIGNTMVQTLPPYLENSSFDVDMLVAMMSDCGVDKAVLLQNPVFGIINQEIATAIENYPSRFIGTLQVDPLAPDAIEIIKKNITPKQSVLKLEISKDWGWSGSHSGLRIDSPEFMQIWELASDMGVQIIIDPGSINNPGYQVEHLDKISNQYPNVKFLLEHFGYLTKDLSNDNKALERRLELIKLAHKKNIFLGFSATGALLDDDYPCTQSLALLKETVAIVGSNKILWGSDIPTTLNKYTYQQMIDVVLKHTSFLSNEEKDQIMYKNALSFFNQFGLT
jgi:hypothetical protein